MKISSLEILFWGEDTNLIDQYYFMQMNIIEYTIYSIA